MRRAMRRGGRTEWADRLRGAVLAVSGVLAGGAVEAKDYKLYYLGGQSNMDGYGHVDQLTEEQKKPIENVVIFHGNTAKDGDAVDGRGVWAPLQLGHGVGFASDGKKNRYSNRFGVEWSFAQRLRELDPDSPIALVKYSRGGTSIDARAAGGFGCWEPDFQGGQGAGKGVNQYDHFLATLRGASENRDVDGDGEPDRLIPTGILWMQGESDAQTPESAQDYEKNLKRLMDLVRASLRADDLPVAVGRISDAKLHQLGKPKPAVKAAADPAKPVDPNKPAEPAVTWIHGEVIREAQAAFCQKDGRAALVVSTDQYGYSDPWHYDGAGYLDLGVKFADALRSLDAPPAMP